MCPLSAARCAAVFREFSGSGGCSGGLGLRLSLMEDTSPSAILGGGGGGGGVVLSLTTDKFRSFFQLFNRMLGQNVLPIFIGCNTLTLATAGGI